MLVVEGWTTKSLTLMATIASGPDDAVMTTVVETPSPIARRARPAVRLNSIATELRLCPFYFVPSWIAAEDNDN